ncbi:MAG: hypothetical protein ACOCYT_01460 [Chloroflexota bacterium]
MMNEQRLQPGSPAPTVNLIDEAGVSVNLSHLWSQGPTLLTFLRHFG